MIKCQCATEKRPENARMSWRWGGCSDNIKHGKRSARNFLELHSYDDDPVSEIMRHNSEVKYSQKKNNVPVFNFIILKI